MEARREMKETNEHVAKLGRTLKCLILSLLASIRDPVY